jgi:hypothetical protein
VICSAPICLARPISSSGRSYLLTDSQPRGHEGATRMPRRPFASRSSKLEFVHMQAIHTTRCEWSLLSISLTRRKSAVRARHRPSVGIPCIRGFFLNRMLRRGPSDRVVKGPLHRIRRPTRHLQILPILLRWLHHAMVVIEYRPGALAIRQHNTPRPARTGGGGPSQLGRPSGAGHHGDQFALHAAVTSDAPPCARRGVRSTGLPPAVGSAPESIGGSSVSTVCVGLCSDRRCWLALGGIRARRIERVGRRSAMLRRRPGWLQPQSARSRREIARSRCRSDRPSPNSPPRMTRSGWWRSCTQGSQ